MEKDPTAQNIISHNTAKDKYDEEKKEAENFLVARKNSLSKYGEGLYKTLETYKGNQ